MNVNTEICKAFNKNARRYEQTAKIQQEIGLRLFERLDLLKIKPRYILDLGCGSGFFTQRLKKYYPNAHIVGLDLALGMLREAKAKQGWFQKWSLVNGDMSVMPFATGLFDLVFSNQVIHWSSSLTELMSELSRVMAPGGCLMFSTLGPDTFCELRKAWGSIDNYAHANDFLDMHDIGDYLLAEHFLDPVVDMEVLHAHYSSLRQLVDGLKAQGVKNINPARNPGLTGKSAWKAFEKAMAAGCKEADTYPLTYEVVYGHAWKGEQRRTSQGTETMISVEQLRKTLPTNAINKRKGNY